MMDVKICIGSSCHLKGSKLVVEKLQQLLKNNSLQDKVDLSGAFCMSRCQEGVCVAIGEAIHSVKPETVEKFFETEIKCKI